MINAFKKLDLFDYNVPLSQINRDDYSYSSKTTNIEEKIRNAEYLWQIVEIIIQLKKIGKQHNNLIIDCYNKLYDFNTQNTPKFDTKTNSFFKKTFDSEVKFSYIEDAELRGFEEIPQPDGTFKISDGRIIMEHEFLGPILFTKEAFYNRKTLKTLLNSSSEYSGISTNKLDNNIIEYTFNNNFELLKKIWIPNFLFSDLYGIKDLITLIDKKLLLIVILNVLIDISIKYIIDYIYPSGEDIYTRKHHTRMPNTYTITNEFKKKEYEKNKKLFDLNNDYMRESQFNVLKHNGYISNFYLIESENEMTIIYNYEISNKIKENISDIQSIKIEHFNNITVKVSEKIFVYLKELLQKYVY